MTRAHLPQRDLRQLKHPFFARPAIDLAHDLIGKVLVRKLKGRVLRARIVETEAYIGVHDLASHASKGRTKRTDVMFGAAGRAYVCHSRQNSGGECGWVLR